MQGRTENSIKNYFNTTVRKNIRRANKKLIFIEKINGSIQELMKNHEMYYFIFCNALESEKMVNKMIEERKLHEERQKSLAAGNHKFISIPTINQDDLINQRLTANALREFYNYLTMTIYLTNQAQVYYS